jgi:hypothetical protein
MIGAIAGDIVGFVHEGLGTKIKRFPLSSIGIAGSQTARC